MWVWHACLSSISAPCQIRSWADLGELLAALVLLFSLIVAFFILLVSLE